MCFSNKKAPIRGSGRFQKDYVTGLSLARLEAPVGLVYHVNAALAADDAVIPVPAFKRFQ